MAQAGVRAVAARLEGMDLHAALDLDGSGTIHKVVLTRSLRIFDEKVFTEEALHELFTSLAVSRDGRVSLQALTQLLAEPTTSGGVLSSPQSRTEQVIDAIHAYTNSLVGDIRGFREVVDPEAIINAAGDSPEEMTRLREDLKKKAKQFVLESQRRNIIPLWDQFDPLGTGVLDPEECNNLVAAYLKVMAEKCPQVISNSIELGIELSIMVSQKTIQDERSRAIMRQHAKTQVEAIQAKVVPPVQQMLRTMAQEDPSAITRELLGRMDLNKDGQVTREEFERRFVDSMQDVLGPDGLMDKIRRVNSLSP